MKQTSFAQAEFAAKKKITRRERVLAEMEQAVPWSRLLEALSLHYYPDSRFPRQARTPAYSSEAHSADVLCSAVVCPGRRSTGRRHL
jgi:hypothetical protein